MRESKPTTIDFETEAIDQRPFYPPKPVGVSIKKWGKKARYYAWGHPTENNCTFEEAKAALAAVWAKDEILCHNLKFDMDVAETFMGMPRLPWNRYHDTMITLFLFNPHLISFGLKPAAEALLGMASTERDEVRQWLVDNGVVSSQATKQWGAHICKAPGTLVGTYADGDVLRTEALFKHTHKLTRGQAYDRERRLLPVLLDMEREGIPVDMPRLKSDEALYSAVITKVEAWVFKRMGCAPFRITSASELVEALIATSKVDTTLLGKTAKGAWRTDKDSLGTAITDPTLASMLNYHASLGTCLNTFMRPWLRMAEASDGRIFTSWNQIKSFSGNREQGAVTGRLSSSPNFQNMPNEFAWLWAHEEAGLPKEKRKGLPKMPIKDLPAPPVMRSYIIAEKGMTLIDRDYSQQEPRILAHFEDGDLSAAYQANPWLDMHDVAKEELEKSLHRSFPRKQVKNINLGLIYGMGIGLMAKKNDSTYEETRQLKDAILGLYPGLKDMQHDMKLRAQNNQPIRTWGGRSYFCEPAKLEPDGRLRTFDYKMVNVLVQGSAADCTKEAILRYHDTKPKGHRLLLTVHDELLAMVPTKEAKQGMEVMRVAMEGIEFDVPMLSEGKMSATNWAEMKDTDKKGVQLA